MSLANELRIGNWVEILGDSKRLDFFTTIQPSSFSVNIDKTYGAIPLDEDWLQKFGFEEWHKRDWDIGGCGDGQILTVTTYAKNPIVRVCGEDMIHIKFVHQLQNLFFAVTQTELQFKNDQPNL